MRCIFCKQQSDNSSSVEHVLPESFGNKEHVLPAGWVCDTCNNYFSRKVEKPFLECGFGRSIRHFMAVPSKKGRTPSTLGMYPLSRCAIELAFDEIGMLCVSGVPGEGEQRFVDAIRSHSAGRFYIPDPGLPAANHTTSRFIAKVGLEVLALRGTDSHKWNDKIVENRQLDELRDYARRGICKEIWPVSIRQIYPRDFVFPADEVSECHQLLNEWTVLVTPDAPPHEFHAVIAMFGVEVVINLGGPELDGWNAWLSRNRGASPLYPKGIPRAHSGD